MEKLERESFTLQNIEKILSKIVSKQDKIVEWISNADDTFDNLFINTLPEMKRHMKDIQDWRNEWQKPLEKSQDQDIDKKLQLILMNYYNEHIYASIAIKQIKELFI